ncbi:MAG: histone deacetylase family protein, partial [Ilumatobacteraceae bacterium]
MNGPTHQERPARLGAVIDGAREAGVADALVALEPRSATRDEVLRVHTPEHLDRIEAVVRAGGGRLDPDTRASTGSMTAAMLAAGAGLTAIEALDAGRADAAF